ncbi:glycoside hydrolase [Candidatus Sumerlaeota bacterium]|nr:glycoside hydrolase [Candidatus Sumerlaeota bacterium]
MRPVEFKRHIDFFNGMEEEDVVNLIPNARSFEWIRENVPLFECPDRDFERVYYFRWWTFRKHIKETPDGFVITEFILPVRHAGVHNTVSCATGFHLAEGRWLRDRRYLDQYTMFWFRGSEGGPQPHFHKYSSWVADALWGRYLVDGDREFVVGLLDDLVRDYEKWEEEKGLPDGLFWQFDVRDGMEESISGSRKAQNARPTIGSYMFANARAIARVAEMAGRDDVAERFRAKAESIRRAVERHLWDPQAKFYKVRFEDGTLSDAREAIGFIPWCFDLPEAGREEAWREILDPEGFQAPKGLTTAERRHPLFRSHGVGDCEWDGAVWPFATSQTLGALANVLRHYKQDNATRKDYFDALLTYARSHEKNGKPYIGEYHDEVTGEWLKGDNPRSRYYNHSTFCDLAITGLVGLCPRDDDVVEIDPLIPADAWDWFRLEGVPYRGRTLTIVWDRDGTHYEEGRGLRVLADGREIVRSDALARIEGRLEG